VDPLELLLRELDAHEVRHPADRPREVGDHLLEGEDQDVGAVTDPPVAVGVLGPREGGARSEGQLQQRGGRGHQGPEEGGAGEVVHRDEGVLGVAQDADVAGRLGVGDALPGEVGLDHPQARGGLLLCRRAREGDEDVLVDEVRPRDHVVDVLELPLAPGRDLVGDLQHPVRAALGVGAHDHVVGRGSVLPEVLGEHDLVLDALADPAEEPAGEPGALEQPEERAQDQVRDQQDRDADVPGLQPPLRKGGPRSARSRGPAQGALLFGPRWRCACTSSARG
jgi:hypothetical protein